MKKLLALTLLLTSIFAAAFDFVRDKKVVFTVILPDNAGKFEKLAADEFAFYFNKMTGSKPAVIAESKAKNTANAIYLGQTKFAARNGVNFSKLANEEWVIKNAGKNLILSGGNPIGSYYAARRLFDELGIFSLAPDEEVVPKGANLTLNVKNEQKKPAIPGRNLYDGRPSTMNVCKVPMDVWQSYWTWRLRNFYNGGHGFVRSKVPDALYIGKEFNLTPFVPQWHSMGAFVRGELFDKHPEYFAADANGKRIKPSMQGRNLFWRSGLCYSNKDVHRITLERLHEIIEYDRKNLPKEKWPEIYDISSLDNFPHTCKCKECTEVIRKNGADGDLLFYYINYVAENIVKKYPEIKIRTYAAYSGAYTAPKTIKPAKNVLLQYTDSFSESDGYKPLEHPVNKKMYKRFTDWAKCGKIMLWDYAIIGGIYFTPPRIETVFDAMCEDAKTFRKHNVQGVFCENELDWVVPFVFYDMQQFVCSRAWVDPDFDREKYVNIFMDNYYGPAAPLMKEYLAVIRNGVNSYKKPQLTNRVGKWPYVNGKTLINYYLKIKELDKKLANTKYQRRVRQEALTLLYTILNEKINFAGELAAAKLDTKAMLKEYEAWTIEFINRLKGTNNKRVMAEYQKRLKVLQVNIPVPEEFKNVPPGDIRLIAYPNFRPIKHLNANIVDDPEALTGKALKSANKDPKVHGGKTIIQATKTMRIPAAMFCLGDNRYTIGKIPQDEKYHYYKFPKPIVLTANGYFWGHCWAIQANTSHLYMVGDGTEDLNKYDVWFRAKFTGPAWVKGSSKENAIYLDMIILTRPGAPVTAKTENYAPIPPEFKDVPKKDMHILSHQTFRAYPKGESFIVEDADAFSAKVIKSAKKDPKYHGANTYVKINNRMNIAPSMFCLGDYRHIIKTIPQDEKYHWYKFTRPVTLKPNSYFWGHFWAIQSHFRHLYKKSGTPADNTYDAYFRVKFTGPRWVAASKQENAIYLDMIILTKPGTPVKL